MIICSNCNLTMTCVKTGRTVILDANTIIAGDEYACDCCGAKVVNVLERTESFFVEDVRNTLGEKGIVDLGRPITKKRTDFILKNLKRSW